MPTPTTRQRPLMIVLLAMIVTALFGATAQAQDAPAGEGVQTTLRVTPSDPEAEKFPVEGVEIIVYAATIENREIQEVGEQVGTGTSDAEGYVFVAVPEPGSYAVEINLDTLPEGVELVRADKQQLPVEARAGQPTTVIFNLAESDVASAARGKESDSLLTRGTRLTFEGLIFGISIGLCAVGLSLIYGTTGLVNFAHGELIVFGALMAYVFNAIVGIDLVWSTVLAMFVGGLFGASLDLVLWRPLRRRGIGLTAMMIVSIGLALFLRFLFLFRFGERSRPYDDYAVQTDPFFTVGPVDVLPKEFVIVLVGGGILVGVGLALQYTKMGKAMRAVSDSNDLAASTGIDVNRVVSAVWFAGGALAAVGAIFFGMNSQISWLMGQQLLLLVFAAVTLGGLGTFFGAAVGSLVIGVLTFLSTLLAAPELKNVGALFIMIVILMIRPQGIFGRRERIG
jgi:branched-chain amino acid transport system permease protein